MSNTNYTNWENLAIEAKFCPHSLAALCHVSLRTLQRRFDADYGMPVAQWIRKFRVAQAYDRISGGEPVKVVAYDLGFKQLSHFSRVFKEIYGVAPTFISPGTKRGTGLSASRKAENGLETRTEGTISGSM